MRICFVSGIVVDVDWLVELKALRDQHGYEIAAVVASDEGPTGDRLRAWDIPYHVRRLDLGRDRAAIYDAILDLARLFRREGYDVVQGHDFNSAVLARAAAWVADVPVRATRVLGTVHLEAPLSRVLEQATCWMNTLLLGVDYTLSQYRSMGVPPARLAWIASSVDPTKFEVGAGRGAYLRQAFGFSEDSALVGLVGHFYPRLAPSPWTPELMYGRCAKGHEDLLRAAPEILEALPHVRFVMLGGVVTGKARRWDVSWMFLACFLGMVLARVLLLGQNPWVFVHQLGNGALLLFAFFMISDPMTIPNHRRARLLYALIVAAFAIWWQYVLFRPNALVWALFLCTPLVPLLDRLWRARRFQWKPA